MKGKYLQAIKDTKVADASWRTRHWETLRGCYSRAPHYRDYVDVFEPLYRDGTETLLSDINRRFLEAIASALGIGTRITWSMDYDVVDGKTERLLSLCRQAGATDYLSGPAARDYLDEEIFRAAGISVSWMKYGGYPEYDQRCLPFEHSVSVLDLLFNVGADAPNCMLSFAS